MHKPSISLYIPVDLAAFCSVAFVILLLYLSMARPKVPEPVKIDMPETSGYQCMLDGLGDAMVLMGEGKVFVSIPDPVKGGVFKRVAALQKITFTAAQAARFKRLQFIGTSPDSINTDNISAAGLSDNGLAEWLKIAGEEYKTIYSRPMRTSIKADKTTSYAGVKKVIAVLQHQGINKIIFITATKNSNDD